MSRRAWIVVACLAASSLAHADNKAKAKQLYEDGLRHFQVAEYDQAIAAWKESYLLVHKPLLLFNIGQAYRLAGDCAHALTFFDNYLREEPSPKNQDDVDQAVATCKAAEKPAEPVKPVAEPPKPVAEPPKPVAEPPKPVAPAPEPVKPAPEPVVVAPHHGMRTAGIVVGSVGVAAGLAGIFFAVQSGHDSSKLDGYTGTWGQSQIDTQNAGKRANTLGWAFGIGGVALAAAGATMFVLGGRDSTHGVAIAPTRGGAAVAWGTSF